MATIKSVKVLNVARAAAKNAKYTIVGDTVWYEDDQYKIPLQTFRGKNKKFIEGSIEAEIASGHPSAKDAIKKSGEYYRK